MHLARAQRGEAAHFGGLILRVEVEMDARGK